MTGQEYTRPPMAVQEYTCGSCMHRWHMPGACGSPSEVRCQCGDAWLAEVVRQAKAEAWQEGHGDD